MVGILSILGTNFVFNVANGLVAFSSLDSGDEILSLVVKCIRVGNDGRVRRCVGPRNQ